MKWGLRKIEFSPEVHVVPVVDGEGYTRHEFSRWCACQPSLDMEAFIDPEIKGLIWLHREES